MLTRHIKMRHRKNTNNTNGRLKKFTTNENNWYTLICSQDDWIHQAEGKCSAMRKSALSPLCMHDEWSHLVYWDIKVFMPWLQKKYVHSLQIIQRITCI